MKIYFCSLIALHIEMVSDSMLSYLAYFMLLVMNVP